MTQQFFFVCGDLDLCPLTLTFKLVRARYQTRPRCEFGANRSAVPEMFDSQTKWMKKKRAKDVLPNIDRTQAPEITPSSDANTQWCHPLLLHAVCSERIPFVCCRGGDGRAKCSFCTWWHWRLTLTFKLIQVRDQTRPPSEFAANAFSGSQGISCTNKKHNEEVTDSPKNRTLLACSNDHVKRLRKIYY